jgi:hypothetical protein
MIINNSAYNEKYIREVRIIKEKEKEHKVSVFFENGDKNSYIKKFDNQSQINEFLEKINENFKK